jgi:hypothetical protein
MIFFFVIASARAFWKEVAHSCFCTLPVSVSLYRAACFNRLALSGAKMLKSSSWVTCEKCDGRMRRSVLWIIQRATSLPVNDCRAHHLSEGVGPVGALLTRRTPWHHLIARVLLIHPLMKLTSPVVGNRECCQVVREPSRVEDSLGS